MQSLSKNQKQSKNQREDVTKIAINLAPLNDMLSYFILAKIKSKESKRKHASNSNKLSSMTSTCKKMVSLSFLGIYYSFYHEHRSSAIAHPCIT